MTSIGLDIGTDTALLLWVWILSSQRSWRRKIKKKGRMGNAWQLVRERSKHCTGR